MTDARAAALARAFHAEPAWSSLWPDARVRARALRAFLSIPVAEGQRSGHVDVTAGGAGVAVWFPPGAYPFGAAQRLRATPRLLQVAAIAPASMPRLARFNANIDAAFPSERPWYLAALGVVPEAQGRGHGTELLRRGLGRCAGAPAYLETSTARAARLYERAGFEVVEEGARLLPDGPTHWRMRCPPRRGDGQRPPAAGGPCEPD